MTDEQSRKAQTQALFNALAPIYDSAGPGNFAYFGGRLVDLVGVLPGQRVLDVATGRGAVLIPAAERAGPAGGIVGIDLADGMVEATRAEAERRGIKVDVLAMDAEQLEFADASFDRVICGFGVMFFQARDRALSDFDVC